MSELYPATKESFGERRLSVELTNICNLHCSYCLRDEDALYNKHPNFLSLELASKNHRQRARSNEHYSRGIYGRGAHAAPGI